VSAPVFPDSPLVVAAQGAAQEAQRLARAAADPEQAAKDFSDRLLRAFLSLCENPRTRQGMLRMVRSSVGSARAGRAFYRVLNRTVVNPAARATGMHSSALRYELVCGQLVGLAMMRYVLQVEPVASTPADEIVRQFAPAIRATLRGS
jgi:plasmid stabilization system protein ParE